MVSLDISSVCRSTLRLKKALASKQRIGAVLTFFKSISLRFMAGSSLLAFSREIGGGTRSGAVIR